MAKSKKNLDSSNGARAPWAPPKSLTILSQEWTVNRINEDSDCDGSCQASLCIINIDKQTPVSRVGEIFIHELLHALWMRVGLHCGGFDEPLEEKVVSALAPALFDTLHRNKIDFS